MVLSGVLAEWCVSEAAIVTEGLAKYYGQFCALRPLDLRVPAGTLFGFLGPNGAGKTTFLRMLMGLLRASAGHARVLGLDVWRAGPRLRRAVGYLPGDVRFYEDLTGAATLQFLDAARGRRGRAELARLAERFDLNLRKRVRDYSRGMKQKLGLIAAMLHRPQLLVLDEPTTALDPLVRQVLYEELRAVAAEGRTVLFSSHTLAEVEALCDEVAILRGGELVEQERITVLRTRALRHVEVRWPPGVMGTPPPGFEAREQGGTVLRGVWRGPVAPLLGWLASAGVIDVVIAPPDLEDLFLAYYGDGQVHAA